MTLASPFVVRGRLRRWAICPDPVVAGTVTAAEFGQGRLKLVVAGLLTPGMEGSDRKIGAFFSINIDSNSTDKN